MNKINRPIIGLIVLWMTAISAYAQSNINLSGYTYGGIAFNSSSATAQATMGVPVSFMITSAEELGGENRMLLKWKSGFSFKDGSLKDSSSFWDKQAHIGTQGTLEAVRARRIYTPTFTTLALTIDPLTETYGLFISTNLTNPSKEFNVIYTEPSQYEIEFSGHIKNTYVSGSSDTNKTSFILGGYCII